MNKSITNFKPKAPIIIRAVISDKLHQKAQDCIEMAGVRTVSHVIREAIVVYHDYLVELQVQRKKHFAEKVQAEYNERVDTQ